SGAENSWGLTLKPSILQDIKNRAVTQSIEIIRGRIDTLGVSEPVIQEHGLGDYQILVQLPGVDDPGRVKDIMQSTAMLEIRQAIDGPYSSDAAAMQAHNGLLPQDAVIMPGTPEACGTKSSDEGACIFVVSRTATVSGADLRDARAAQDENNRPAVQFSLTRN